MTRKIVWAFIAVIVLTALIMGASVLPLLEENIKSNVQENLAALASVTALALQNLDWQAPPGSYDDLARQYSKKIGARVTLINPAGVVLGDSETPAVGMENHANRPEVAQALQGIKEAVQRQSPTLGNVVLLYYAMPVKKGSTIIGVVRLSIPLQQVKVIISRVQNRIVVAAVVAILVALLAGNLLAGRLAEPLKQMAHIAREMAGGKFTVRMAVRGKDEMAVLAESFNLLAVRLADKMKEVQDQQEKLTAVLNSMADGVIAVDHKKRILLTNPSADGLFSIPLRSAQGKELLHSIRHFELNQLFDKVLAKGEGCEGEFTIPYPEEKIIRAHVAPLSGYSGQIAGAVAVFRDVTELRRLERMRSEFVANVTHELGTPLTSIQGFIETLLEGAVDEPATARRFLTIIKDEADRLGRLIKDLLDLSRIENKRADYHFETVNIAEVLFAVQALLEGEGAKRNVTLTVDVPERNLTVWGDFDRLRQIFINLVENAIRYSKSGGNVYIRAEEKQGEVHVSVEDQGIGIPKEKIPRLFERFYRVDPARSRALGGTGLGLSIVKHLVEAHRGRVTVKSEVGKGSTFTVILPVDEWHTAE